MSSFSFQSRFAGIIGNILEHYDRALFGLLAPFIAPLFFCDHDPVTQLILTYAMLPLGVIVRPLGALFFGRMGDRTGRREVLFYSLSGMGLATCIMGSLPTSHSLPYIAPILLLLMRMVQSFCDAGESTVGAIFVLENTQSQKRSLLSSLYDASSIAGSCLASFFVTLLSYFEVVEQGWRLLFWFGGLTALFGLLLRLKTYDFDTTKKVKNSEPLFTILSKNKRALYSIILACGFAHTTYSTAFTFMNGFVPLITPFSKTEMMATNSYLLVLDMLLLPCFGYLSMKIGKERVMLAATIFSLFAGPFLFSLLENGSFGLILFIRLAITTAGVAFAATYHAWTLEQVEPEYRARILTLGNALGALLIGLPNASLCLWIYQLTGWVTVPGLYLSLTALPVAAIIYYRYFYSQNRDLLHT